MLNLTWFVSSPLRVTAGGREQPYGVRHARQAGSVVTECGEAALAWPVFPDIPFQQAKEFVCKDCTAAVLHQVYGPQAVRTVGRQ